MRQLHHDILVINDLIKQYHKKHSEYYEKKDQIKKRSEQNNIRLKLHDKSYKLMIKFENLHEKYISQIQHKLQILNEKFESFKNNSDDRDKSKLTAEIKKYTLELEEFETMAKRTYDLYEQVSQLNAKLFKTYIKKKIDMDEAKSTINKTYAEVQGIGKTITDYKQNFFKIKENKSLPPDLLRLKNFQPKPLSPLLLETQSLKGGKVTQKRIPSPKKGTRKRHPHHFDWAKSLLENLQKPFAKSQRCKC